MYHHPDVLHVPSYTTTVAAAMSLSALRQRAARLVVAGARELEAATRVHGSSSGRRADGGGGGAAALSFEGPAWNSCTVAQIAAARAHCEFVLLEVRTSRLKTHWMPHDRQTGRLARSQQCA